MGDSVKKYYEMMENKEITPTNKRAKYIFLLDYADGKVYRYDISVLCREENKWNPDTESCEQFLELAGHKINNCEWMVTNEEFIQRGN